MYIGNLANKWPDYFSSFLINKHHFTVDADPSLFSCRSGSCFSINWCESKAYRHSTAPFLSSKVPDFGFKKDTGPDPAFHSNGVDPDPASQRNTDSWGSGSAFTIVRPVTSTHTTIVPFHGVAQFAPSGTWVHGIKCKYHVQRGFVIFLSN
jgi:hypothetical protein